MPLPDHILCRRRCYRRWPRPRILRVTNPVPAPFPRRRSHRRNRGIFPVPLPIIGTRRYRGRSWCRGSTAGASHADAINPFPRHAFASVIFLVGPPPVALAVTGKVRARRWAAVPPIISILSVTTSIPIVISFVQNTIPAFSRLVPGPPWQRCYRRVIWLIGITATCSRGACDE